MKDDNLPIRMFADQAEFHDWLKQHHATSEGIWMRIARKNSDVTTVSWEGAVDEGLIFGWSESSRRKCDDKTYLQKFTPRRKVGTVSPRAQGRVQVLLKAGKITPAGKAALGL